VLTGWAVEKDTRYFK